MLHIADESSSSFVGVIEAIALTRSAERGGGSLRGWARERQGLKTVGNSPAIPKQDPADRGAAWSCDPAPCRCRPPSPLIITASTRWGFPTDRTRVAEFGASVPYGARVPPSIFPCSCFVLVNYWFVLSLSLSHSQSTHRRFGVSNLTKMFRIPVGPPETPGTVGGCCYFP